MLFRSEHLIKDEYVIYLKQSNGYLKLKQSSGVDIEQKIADAVASMNSRFSMKEALNASNIDNYVYPSRYNDEKEMTRYFAFQFIEDHEIDGEVDWNKKAENVQADGVIYAIVSNDEESLPQIKKKVIETSRGVDKGIFIIPKKAEIGRASCRERV